MRPALGQPRGSEFVFARLRYDSGDWDYNPKVAANVLNSIVEYTNIRVFPEEVIITADSEELLAFRHGGILPYVARQLVGRG